MPTTANFSLEYPDDNSSVDIAGHFETLADDVDAAINTRLALTGGTLTGSLSGTSLSLSSTLSVTGAITGTNTTDSSSSTTGAIITAGGMGIAKALYIGTTLNVTGATTLTGNVTMSGDLTISKSSPRITMNTSSVGSKYVEYRVGGLARWVEGVTGTAESGSNAGSDFTINAYSDSGTFLSSPLVITRSTGLTTLSSLSVTGNAAFAGILDVSAGPLRVTSSGAYMQLNANAGGNGVFYFTGATGTSRGFMMQTASSNRWKFGVSGDAESTSDAGSNFYIDRYSDAGAYLGAALTVTRATGAMTLTGDLTINKASALLSVTASSGNSTIEVKSPAGTYRDIFLRSNANPRWRIGANSIAESGSSAGSDFWIGRYDDANSVTEALSITRSTGAMTLRGDLTISKAGAYMTINGTSGAGGSLYLMGIAGSTRSINFYTGAAARWDIRTTSATEFGSDAGSDFKIYRYSDAGSAIDAPLSITRSTGKTTLGSVGATAGLELGSSGPRVMSGTGSPEGVVTAPVGSTWIDTAATTGAIKWIKAAGSGSSGWVVEYGDTGWRNLNASLQTGWTGKLLVRRTNSTVTVATANADPLSFAAGAAGTVLTGPPTGFGSTYEAIISARSSADGAAVRPFLWRSGGTAYYYGSTAGGGSLLFSYTTTTAEAWPSSLPGTAA